MLSAQLQLEPAISSSGHHLTLSPSQLRMMQRRKLMSRLHLSLRISCADCNLIGRNAVRSRRKFRLTESNQLTTLAAVRLGPISIIYHSGNSRIGRSLNAGFALIVGIFIAGVFAAQGEESFQEEAPLPSSTDYTVGQNDLAPQATTPMTVPSGALNTNSLMPGGEDVSSEPRR